MSGLLYRKSGSAQRRRVDSHFWPSGPQLLFNSPSAADSRPSTREGLFGLINAIEKHLAEVFSRSADRAAGVAPLGPPPAERARAGQAAVREVIVIDDDYSDSMPGADRRYSLKAAYDKQYVDRIAMSHSKLGLNPDESVQDRIDAMERQSAAEAAEDAMDVVQSAEEQVSLRLQELGGDMKASAVAFLNSSRTSKSAILIQKYDIPMSEFNLRCIAPGKWLNDEVINFYMGMLQEKDNALCAARTGRRPSHFFNLFFVSKLLEGGAYSYRNVKRWTKKIDIFEKDKIFCPVNIANTHWTMCVVHMTERRIQYYDSMGASGRTQLDALMKYLKDEHMDKRGTPLPDSECWLLQPCVRNNTPQQHNGFDCGVFSMLFADFISDNLPLHFEQQNIPDMRVKICASILAGKLWYCQDLF